MKTLWRLTLVRFVTFTTSALLAMSSSVALAEPDVPSSGNLARGTFHTAVFSRDAKLLLTPAGRFAQLWNVETGALIRQFEGHLAAIHSICFSPDETLILTGAGNAGVFGRDDATARIWDVASGKQLAVFGDGEHKGYVSWASFSPDGKRVFALCIDLTSALGDRLVSWDIAARETKFVVPGASNYSHATKWIDPIRISPNGEMLAGLAEESRRISVWNAQTGEVLWHVRGDSLDSARKGRLSFGSLQFSPGGMSLLGVCSDFTARTWSTGVGRELQTFAGHAVDIRAATFCNQGERVVTASQDGTARLWETSSGRQIKQYVHPGPIRRLALNNDSTRLATTWSIPANDGPEKGRQWFMSLWNTTNAREIKRFNVALSRMEKMIFSPDGKRVLVARKDATWLLDSVNGNTIRRYE